MSVTILSDRHYRTALHGVFFNRQLRYRICVLRNMDWGDYAAWMRRLITQTYMSYATRYRDQVDDEGVALIVNGVDFSACTEPMNNCALLKALQAINYQTEQESADVALLQQCIDNLKDMIIGDLSDYRDAEWMIKG